MKVLKGGRLIDGTGAAPVEGATVVIDGNRIAAVTTRNQSDFPADAEIVDVSGMTVLPGLIDCHDHMANHKYDLAHRWRLDEPQSTRHLRTAAVLKQTLVAGYTTIRDAAGLDAGFKRAIEEGLIDGPRLVLSLAIISPYGGIGDAVSPSGLPLDDCCCIPGDPLLPESVCNGIDDVRQVVRKMVRAGADVIKCATTGGASSRPGHGPLDPAFNLDEMQALVDEAHALDRRVMCHALGGRGLDIAIEAGVNSIEHGTHLDQNPRHLERMAERGIFFVPTLLVYEYHRKSPQPHVKERAMALYEHHIESIKRAPVDRGEGGGRHRCRRARPSRECRRTRMPGQSRHDADAGLAGGDRLGRRVPRPGRRARHGRAGQARRSGRRRRRSARRHHRVARSEAHRAGDEGRRGRGEPDGRPVSLNFRGFVRSLVARPSQRFLASPVVLSRRGRSGRGCLR